MSQLNTTGPENKGSKTGRGLGFCDHIPMTEQYERLGKGMGMRRNSGGGQGRGKCLKAI